MDKLSKGTFLEQTTKTGTIEVCIDHDHITIPISRYEELIRAETERDVILRAYQAFTGFRLSDAIEAVLGPRPTEVVPNA